MAIRNVTLTDTTNIGNSQKMAGATQSDAEFKGYDRARSSDAHIVLDLQGSIQPIGYFEKFDATSKTEIIYRHPIGSKVPIGETKPGGWDLNFSNGLIDDRMWGVFDTYHKQKFDGLPSPRITVAQRIKFTHSDNVSKKQTIIYLFFETVLGGYKISDPGNGDPMEESCTGYARFRTLAPV